MDIALAAVRKTIKKLKDKFHGEAYEARIGKEKTTT